MLLPDRTPPPELPLDTIALFLDFDGTLVDLVDRPEAVAVDDPLRQLLTRLGTRLEGRLAIVSGRSIAQLDAFLGAAIADIAVVGSHGAEIRRPGQAIERPQRPAALTAAERAFTERFGTTPGIVIEVKSLGVAIHYRMAPSHAAAADALVAEQARHHGLTMQKGKMMCELRLGGHDKGTALRALMQAPPFAGHRPVFAGDDLTDEPGFAVCADHGGDGILVGPDRDTAATWRIPDVTAFRHWLEAAA